MDSKTLRAQRIREAQRIQERSEKAVAYWIERLADDGASFVGSEDEERFLPLASLLASLLDVGTGLAATGSELDKAERVADQIEAYSLGTKGMRIRARGAHEDMMARREESDVPLIAFQDDFTRLMNLLHAVDAGRSDDLGASLLEARGLLLKLESFALNG